MHLLTSPMNGNVGVCPRICPTYTNASAYTKTLYWLSATFEIILVFAALVVPQVVSSRGKLKKLGHNATALRYKTTLFSLQSRPLCIVPGDTQTIPGCGGRPFNVIFVPAAIRPNTSWIRSGLTPPKNAWYAG